jgi:hypothetical protein
MGLKMKYFVLKPKAKFRTDAYALASQCAMREYAKVIREDDSELADSLEEWAAQEALSQTRAPRLETDYEDAVPKEAHDE